ncbi:hypothetical protein [Actinocatenispora rupis]|uniref:Uncharacterized protein n=1 Tax=Actinocatenispora rupis TaxID=519421 RepID=A0A8J3NAN9_9ACTN|nr:hypothetical protein [Actinocatenispora rupis]GID12306.1 hypothetical protein Aru02nite_31950 [Actinocatenispora rupis]
MNSVIVVLLVASVLFLVLAAVNHGKSRTVRWEWLGIACFVATLLVGRLAALL